MLPVTKSTIIIIYAFFFSFLFSNLPGSSSNISEYEGTPVNIEDYSILPGVSFGPEGITSHFIPPASTDEKLIRIDSLLFDSGTYIQQDACNENPRFLLWNHPDEFVIKDAGTFGHGHSGIWTSWSEKKFNNESDSIASVYSFINIHIDGRTFRKYDDNLKEHLRWYIEDFHPKSDGFALLHYDEDVPLIKMNVEGGRYDGETIELMGNMAYALQSDKIAPDGRWRQIIHSFVLAIGWGWGPQGEFQTAYRAWDGGGYGVLVIPIYVGLRFETYDPAEYPLDDLSAINGDLMKHLQIDGEPVHSVNEYLNGYIGKFRRQLENGELHLGGMIPEWLYLYDFSGKATVSPEKVRYINQYDVGQLAGLPNRAGGPGGNACGPSSLIMLLNHFTNDLPDIEAIFDDVMIEVTGCARRNKFGACVELMYGRPPDQWRDDNGDYNDIGLLYSHFYGKLWLSGEELHGLGGDSGNRKFKVERQFELEAEESPNSTWDDIDQHLDAGFPVIVSTPLSVSGGRPPKGNGHIILLLGRSRNDHIGEYYIVADPAGHFYADPYSSGLNEGHYGQTDLLIQQCKGISYGGWFAIYPRDDFHDDMPRYIQTTMAKSPQEQNTLPTFTVLVR